MKQISYWALLHPIQSRIIIVVSQLLLAYCTTYLGIYCFVQGIVLPTELFFVGLGLFFAAFCLYPIRRARFKFWRYKYVRHKICDTLMIVSFVLMSLQSSNKEAFVVMNPNFSLLEHQEAIYQEATIIHLNQEATHIENKNISKWSRNALKQTFRKYYKSWVTKIAVNPKSALIIFGYVILGVLLSILILGIACDIECSGGPGIFVGVLGIGLIFIILISAIRKAGKKKTKYEPSPPSPSPNSYDF